MIARVVGWSARHTALVLPVTVVLVVACWFAQRSLGGDVIPELSVQKTSFRALGEEVSIVVLVVLVFLLHGRSALVPMATLPLVVWMTFATMRLLGVPATVMSLGGTAIALGMAVGADLVALEACHRRLELGGSGGGGLSRRDRLIAASNSVVPAILISSLIAALAFVPVFVFGGETGRLLRPLALTRTVVVLAAALVTLTVAPALRDRLVRGRIVPELANPLTRGLVRAYRPLVHFALSRPALTLSTAGVAVLSCVPIVTRIGSVAAAGERLEWAGHCELLVAGQHRLVLIVPLVAVVLLLLTLQFRSIAQALIVLASVPLALVGSFWTMYLLGYRLSAPVWVGLLSVGGLAMQTGVVMVVFIDDAYQRRVRAGCLRTRADIVAAHAEGSVCRLRPKLMTIAAMGAGLLPLLWSTGAGSEMLKRVAAPMLGGLITCASLTLAVLPVLSTIWRARQLVAAQRSMMAAVVIPEPHMQAVAHVGVIDSAGRRRPPHPRSAVRPH